MNTPTLVATRQPAYLFNNTESAPVENVHSAVNADIGGEQKDQVVADYLNQLQVVAAAPTTPQIVKPKVSTGVELNQELVTELQQLKSSNEKAYALLQEKFGSLVADYLANPTPEKERVLTNALVCILLASAGSAASSSVKSTPPPDETESIGNLVEDLDSAETEDSFEEAYKRLNQRLTNLVNDYANNPTEQSARSLASALICLLVSIQSIKQTTQAAIVGMFATLGKLCAVNQAEATEEQGTAGLWGGISMAVVTVAIAATGYEVQRRGFNQRDLGFRQKKKLENYQLEVKNNQKNLNKLPEFRQQNDAIRRARMSEYQAELRSMNTKARNAKAEYKAEYRREQAKQEADRLRFEKAYVKEQAKGKEKYMWEDTWEQDKKTKLKEIKDKWDAYHEAGKAKLQAMESKWTTFKSAGDVKFQEMKRVNKEEFDVIDHADIDHYSPRLSELDLKLLKIEDKMYQFNRAADLAQARGSALLSSFNVAQVAQALSGNAQKAFEADSILDSADANIYRELTQLATQVLQAGETYYGTLIEKLLATLLHSPIETVKALAGGMKGG